MPKIHKIVEKMRRVPANVKFAEITKVCDFYFGKPRETGSSHRVYKTPWEGDPRVNVQNFRGEAKSYQVKQVLKAIDRLMECK